MPVQKRKYPLPTTSDEARELCIRVLTDSLARMAREDADAAAMAAAMAEKEAGKAA